MLRFFDDKKKTVVHKQKKLVLKIKTFVVFLLLKDTF